MSQIEYVETTNNRYWASSYDEIVDAWVPIENTDTNFNSEQTSKQHLCYHCIVNGQIVYRIYSGQGVIVKYKQ